MITNGRRITDFISFQKEGLKNVDQAVFAQKNLIIGKNGSGKTRFLKALEQNKRQDEARKERVITLYFPEIQAFYNANREKPSEDDIEGLPQGIYDLLLEADESSFYDFLKVMENDNGDFLENILSVLSMHKTKKSKQAKKTLEELNDLLKEFLNKMIQIDSDKGKIFIEIADNAIENRKLPLRDALAEFSPGELMLFYLCVFLMIIKQQHPDGIILIIDEPELHLHPRALVKMIRMLRDSENISELWIASHSLFLVPLFTFEEIVFVQDNAVISRNSKIYKNLYDSLVGLDNIDIFEFLKSLDDWQYYQFIVECFCLPEPVAKIDIKDEQFCKLLNAVRDIMKTEPIQLLDYGAGKCRIWECMQLLPDIDPGKNNVVYTAYEPYPDGDENRSFKMYSHFEDICADNRQFHVIVLMNVLHEIEGKQWEKTFQNIHKILADDGVLIFLEVLSLTKGEQPYGNDGYLVLQDKQIKILFDDNNIVNMRKNPEEKSNCWMITKKQVGNVSQKTIKESICSLCNSSYDALQEEFQKRIHYAHQDTDSQLKQMSARRYAFLSQQYINAQLTCSSLNITQNIIPSKEINSSLPKTSNSRPIKVIGLKEERKG